MATNIRVTDAWLTFGLAFVGGYGDAASFVLAKTFTGHVTGNLVLGAIAVAAHDWRALLGHVSAIVTFLIGVFLSALIVRPLKSWPSWPLLPMVMGIEVILIVGASLVLASHVAHGIAIFVSFVSLALGLQNGSLSSCRWHQRSHHVSHWDDYQPDLYGSRKIHFGDGSCARKNSGSQNSASLWNLDRLRRRRWDGSSNGPSLQSSRDARSRAAVDCTYTTRFKGFPKQMIRAASGANGCEQRIDSAGAESQPRVDLISLIGFPFQ